MDAIWRHWQHEGILFDAIYTGYLGSIAAINAASQIMDTLLAPDGKIIVDPAMADHGKLYSGFDDAYAKAMTELCLRADIMLPNITEAAMMTGTTYQEEIDEQYVRTLLEKLGGKDVVLTGASFEAGKTGAAIRRGGEVSYYFHDRIGRNFHGTGDIFASSFTGAFLQEKTLQQAVQIAADYTCKCIQATVENPAHWYGVKFETALPELIQMLK
jgi:pyridoxine kinase